MSYAQVGANLISNPNFTSPSGANRTIAGWISSNCQATSTCTINSTTGWKDTTSFQVSTNASTQSTFSSIRGKAIDVTPGQTYLLTTHMKLNPYATKSHISIEAFNQTSNKWKTIRQCPGGTNGPLEWKEFSCQITIPANTMKIRPILYAGWSSQPGNNAVTLFDSISLTKAAPGSNVTKAAPGSNVTKAPSGKNSHIGGFIPGATSQ
jgi:hypothetical protein